MKKDISISIESERIPKGESPQKISVTAEGTFFRKDGLAYITYRENPEEFGKTLTTLKLKHDRMELIRTGNISSRLVFLKNAPYESSYNTPYGSIPLKLVTHRMSLSQDENSGTIHIRYSLNLAGDETENIFTLKYKSI